VKLLYDSGLKSGKRGDGGGGGGGSGSGGGSSWRNESLS